MVFLSAKQKCQYGLGLLELVVALSIGSVVILAISQLLIASTASASQIQRHISVQEKLLDLQMVLSKELRRAGYHFLPNHTSTFTDQTELVFVDDSESDVGLVYQVKANGSEAFRNVYFNYSPAAKQLKLCDKYSSSPLSTHQAALSSFGSACYALLDEKQYRLTDFQVNNKGLGSPLFRSSIINVDMTLALVT